MEFDVPVRRRHLRVHQIAVPTPFPVGDVNAFLLDEEPLTMVDCGPLTEDAWAALKAGVERTGRRLAEVRRLVLTHSHIDHAGLAERVRRLSGCRVYAHPSDLHRLLGVPEAARANEAFLVELCRRAGAPATHLDALADWFQSHQDYSEPLSEVEPLHESSAGALKDEGEFARLHVLHTPGHARGALCLWEPHGRELFSGDTLLGQISSNAVAEPATETFRQKTLPQYLQTLETLASLGTSRVYPGHGALLDGDVKVLVEGRFRFHEKRAARVLSLVRGGLRTPWTIADRLFQGLPLYAVFLAVSEVVGHLDLLAERGEVVFEGQDRSWEVTPA